MSSNSKIKSAIIWGAATLIVLVSIPIIYVTLIPPKKEFDGYNFSSNRQRESEQPIGLSPGEPFPREFTVYDTNGQKVNLDTMWSDKPLVIEFGSRTCTIFHGNGPSMDELYAKYDKGHAEQARIRLLYVREAHPGWFNDHLSSQKQKIENARYLNNNGITRTIWVDSLDGELHQILGPWPNAVYVIDTNGNIAYKSVWNVPTEVDQILNKLINKQSITPELSNFCYQPANYYTSFDMLAYVVRIAFVSGPDAFFDFLINRTFAERFKINTPVGCN